MPLAATLTTASASTSTSATVDPVAKAITDCVAYIPIGAFTGNREAADLWTFISQDPAQLGPLCTQLQIDNPTMLATFSTNYAAVLAAAPPTDSAAATSTTSPASGSSTSSP